MTRIAKGPASAIRFSGSANYNSDDGEVIFDLGGATDGHFFQVAVSTEAVTGTITVAVRPPHQDIFYDVVNELDLSATPIGIFRAFAQALRFTPSGVPADTDYTVSVTVSR